MRVRCLQLYLLMASYSVKTYLNDNVKIFESEMHELLPGFSQIFNNWGNKFAKDALLLNPKQLNSSYEYYTYKPHKYKQA